MYCLHYAERPQPDNQLSFKLHKLVFSRVSFTVRFVSVINRFVQFKILQPYVARTVRMHSDAVFSSIGASQIETVIKNYFLSTNSGSLKNHFRFGFGSRIDVNGPYSSFSISCLKARSRGIMAAF